MTKNDRKNLGLPMYVDYKKDLALKPGVSSWYVISNFEADGQQLGFMWHEQLFPGADHKTMLATAEFLLMDGSTNTWIDNEVSEPVSKRIGADSDKLHVFSPLGTLCGNHEKMTLKLTAEKGSLDVVLKPRKHVLYNGTTGRLNFAGMDNFQYAFPNMDIEGVFTLEGKSYPITNATAWFDRQISYGLDQSAFVKPDNPTLKFAPPSWLWLGMSLGKDNNEAISLWDAYIADERHGFATVLNADGTLMNVTADVTYDNIWTSSRTGNHYPGVVNISVPTSSLNLKLTAMIDEPEFVHKNVNIEGCQSLCKVTGSYKGEKIDRYVILEMVGDICGE